MSKWKHPYADNTVKNFHGWSDSESQQSAQPVKQSLPDKSTEATSEEMRLKANALRLEAEALAMKADSQDAIDKRMEEASSDATKKQSGTVSTTDAKVQKKFRASADVRNEISQLDVELEKLGAKPNELKSKIQSLLEAVEGLKKDLGAVEAKIVTKKSQRAELIAEAEKLEKLEEANRKYAELIAEAEKLKSFLVKEGYIS